MPQDLRLGLRLTADAKGFVGEVRVSKKELDRLTGATRKTDQAAQNYARSIRRGEVATRSATQLPCGARHHGAHGRWCIHP